MSLIAKNAARSLLQNKLQAQLADRSYQAINGTRQSVRNFREGTLNIGTMHFSTPDEKITKEMIMDYQKKEQEKHYDDGTNKFQYVPTGLTDSLKIFSPKAYKTFKDGATEEILKKEQDTLNTIYEDLRTSLQEAKTKKKEIVSKTDETNTKQHEIDETLDKLKAEQLILKELTAKAKKEKDATRKAEIKAEMKIVEDKILIEIPAKLLTLRGEHLALDTERKRLVKDYNTFITTVVTPRQVAAGNQITEIEQVKDNIKINKEAQQDVNNKNKEITKKYTETFNIANRDRYSIQQDPYESDADYIARISKIEASPYDANVFKEKAANEGNKQLMANLRNSLRDEVKISEIVKSFSPEEVFIINTNWKAIQEQLKIKFGINNPIVKVKDYNDEIINVIDTLQNKPFGATLLPASTTSASSSVTLAGAIAPTSTKPLIHSDGTPSDFISAVENNSLYIGNVVNGKAIWVKIGYKSRNFIMFSNTTNDEKSFRAFKHTGMDDFSFKKIMQILGLDKDIDIRNQLFGPPGSTAIDKFNHLKDNIKLSIESGKVFFEGTEHVYGWGIKHDEEVPKLANFGKNIILLNKLYYKNILSVKNKKMHSVEHMPNVKVSDTLADIIFNMCKNEHPTKQILDTLKTGERELFDLLLYVSGLGKSKHISKEIDSKKNTIIKELKERLKLVEAEIQAGNNNPVVKAELKEIVNKLVLYNVISQNNGKKYLQQF